MIFICNIIIYPLIKKKNKIQPCVFLSLNIVIVSKNLKKLTNNVSLSKRKKNLHNILGVSVLGPVGTRPD